MKFTVMRRGKPVTLPAFALPRDVLEQVAQVIEGSILANIVDQKQADGSPLQENAQSTKLRKKRAGRPIKSLIDREHRFVRGNQGSWSHEIAAGEKWMIVFRPATDELKKLNRYVQAKGYVGWFRASVKGANAARLLIKQWITRAVNRR